MSASLVLEWLNENALRAYPIRLQSSREILIQGYGMVSPGPYDAAHAGWVLNGVVDNTVSPASSPNFVEQLAPGDIIAVGNVRSTVLPGHASALTGTTLYLAADLALSPASYKYKIVKQARGADNAESPTSNLDGLLLDANLVYNEVLEDGAAYGRLISMQPVEDDLRVVVSGQTDFVVPDYLNATYPVYVRNDDGSLLVFGESVKTVKSLWEFTNYFFEPSTIARMGGAWQGVASLAFNGDAAVSGDVVFTEGYQLGLSTTLASNAINLTASKTAGLPIGCTRVLGGVAPDDCGTLLSYINGAHVRTAFGDLELQAGEHIAVFPDPDRHRIYVGLTFDHEDICVPPPPRPVTQI